MLKYFSFNQRLVFSFVALSFSGMCLTSYIVYRQADQIVTELTMSDLKSQMRSLKNMVDIMSTDNIERLKETSAQIGSRNLRRLEVDSKTSRFMSVKNQVTQEVVEVSLPRLLIDNQPLENHNFVDQILADTGNAATLFLKSDYGFVRVSTNIRQQDGSRAISTYIPNDSEVAKVLLSGQPYYGRAMVLSKWYMTGYEPLKDSDGKTVGAFFVGFPDTAYVRIKSFLSSQKLLESGYYYILDSKANMVMHPTLEGKNVLGNTDIDGTKIFEKMVTQKSGVLDYRWTNAETKAPQEKTALFEYFPETDWVVAASLNTDEVHKHVYSLRSVIGITTAASIAILAIFIAVMARSISNRLGRISDQIKDSTANVSSQAGLMLGSSIKLAEASTEQAAAVQETAATIDEISAMVTKNLESASHAKTSSESTQTMTQNGRQAMATLEDSVRSMNQRSEETQLRVQESYQEIHNIVNLVKDVQNKIKVINDIVFQTKLLSFNAAVEAARAGEHGKGFAVVAAEVGNLAQMTGSSATEITQSVSSMVDKIENIITSANHSVEEIFALAKLEAEKCMASANETTSALTLISENIASLHQDISEVASASQEQSEGVRQLATAMHQIDSATQQNDSLATQSQTNSNELAAHANRLKESMQELIELRDGASRSAKVESPAPAAKKSKSATLPLDADFDKKAA